MNIQDICNQHWYLALYITGGRNREKLFDWLSDLDVTAWTPMTLTKIPRSDKPHVFRKRVSAVFPGYFFLKANFDFHNINKIRMHSAFCDFVKLGRQIAPVSPTVVDALMKVYPDPAFHPAVRTERESASDVWLTKQQYQHLMHIDSTAHPVSRIAMLLDLINHPESHGY
ncbi:TPA: transcription termination factor NusG [Kluyvera ascorbata]|nr:transcription termination factor NusG [Kluyvera ascorbata]